MHFYFSIQIITTKNKQIENLMHYVFQHQVSLEHQTTATHKTPSLRYTVVNQIWYITNLVKRYLESKGNNLKTFDRKKWG